jgi:hypothetical protein
MIRGRVDRHRRYTALLLSVVIAAVSWSGTGVAGTTDITLLCTRAAGNEERARHIPDGLVQALALAESGRRSEKTKALVTWPWTVMAEGEGRYYPDKAAAVRAVEMLLARGIRNADVGCMQINLMHHATAFESLDEAFDPTTNVAYGARYLAALKREFGSWFTAIKRYHSSKPEHHLRYRTRVFRIWRNTKRRLMAGGDSPKLPARSIERPGQPRTTALAYLSAAPTVNRLIKIQKPRREKWRNAFQHAEGALEEWRRISVLPQVSDALDIARTVRRAKIAMAVLKRGGTY